jgi:hypothetical protein
MKYFMSNELSRIIQNNRPIVTNIISNVGNKLDLSFFKMSRLLRSHLDKQNSSDIQEEANDECGFLQKYMFTAQHKSYLAKFLSKEI